MAIAAAGLPLGFAFSYFRSAPLTSRLGDFILLAVAAVIIWVALLLGLLARAVSLRSPAPLLTAALLVLAGAAGMAVAPPGVGTTVASGGTGSLGNRDDAGAFWSGPVECRWLKGWGTVMGVVGFDLPLTDPALVAELGLDQPNVVPTGLMQLRVAGLYLPSKPAHAALPKISGQGMFMAGGQARPFPDMMDMGSDLLLESVSPNMDIGRAVSPTGMLVFNWACSGGP